MQTARQLGSGLLYALVSVVLVVGGLSLALAENNILMPPSATSSPIAFSPTLTLTPTRANPSQTPSATPFLITQTPSFPTIYVPPLPTNTAIPCGPFPGWVKNYVVQPGDTLFHIAMLYGTTVANLERANCKSSSVIFPGDRLWVPNVPTITPGVTIIPEFDTPTAIPTEPLTLTPLPYTATVVPTDTNVPDP